MMTFRIYRWADTTHPIRPLVPSPRYPHSCVPFDDGRRVLKVTSFCRTLEIFGFEVFPSPRSMQDFGL